MPTKKPRRRKLATGETPKRVKRRRKANPNRLQTLRLAKRLTIDDVAQITGAFRSAVNRWENDQAEPRADFRDKLAECLGITKAELGAIVYGG